MTKKQIRKDLKITLKDAITNFFAGKEVTAFHPLDLIFPRERRIRSLIGGLETSLGTQVWEPVAKTLARNNGFTILDEKEFNASVPDIPVDVMHKLSDFENRKLKDQELLCCDYFTDIKGFINEANIVSVDLIKIPKGEGALTPGATEKLKASKQRVKYMPSLWAKIFFKGP